MTTPSSPSQPEREPNRRSWGTLLAVALLGVLLGFWFVNRTPEPEPEAQRSTSMTVGAEAAGPTRAVPEVGPAPDARTAEVEPNRAAPDKGRINLSQPYCVPEDQEPSYARPSLAAYLFDHFRRTEQLKLAQATSDFGLSRRFFSDGGPDDAPSLERTRGFVEQQLQDHPERAASWALKFELELADGHLEQGLVAIHRAESLDPQAPALFLAEHEALRLAGDVPRALQALLGYLALQPNDDRMRRRAALLGVEVDIEADYPVGQSGGITVRASPEFARANDLDRVAETVRTLREEAARFSGIPAREPLSVTIFPSRTELMAVSCVNEWAGGYYDGTIKLVELRGHLLPMEDLRHELMHAVALSRLPSDRPLWFTEGLADYFSTRKRLHPQKERLLLQNRTLIPVDSLVGTLQILNTADAELAYAESDVLVALLIDARGQAVVPEALRHLRNRGDPRTLAATLLGHELGDDEFFDYLARRQRSP